MSARPATKETSSFARLPRLQVRDPQSRGQMLTFTVVSVATLAFMMLLPSPRAAFGAVDRDGPAVEAASVSVRLPDLSEVERMCAGQSWGTENLDCILAIASEGGVERTVRLADAALRY